jgi:hypothetical protein
VKDQVKVIEISDDEDDDSNSEMATELSIPLQKCDRSVHSTDQVRVQVQTIVWRLLVMLVFGILNRQKWTCFIRSNDSSLIPVYYHKGNKKLNKTKVFNQTFLTIGFKEYQSQYTILSFKFFNNNNLFKLAVIHTWLKIT